MLLARPPWHVRDQTLRPDQAGVQVTPATPSLSSPRSNPPCPKACRVARRSRAKVGKGSRCWCRDHDLAPAQSIPTTPVIRSDQAYSVETLDSLNILPNLYLTQSFTKADTALREVESLSPRTKRNTINAAFSAQKSAVFLSPRRA